MPELLQINAILWQNLLRDFQIVAPPRVPVWWLSDTVLPVAIVNSQVNFEATLSETAMEFATEGVKVAPAANVLLADTGALPVGRYLFRVYYNYNDVSANGLTVQHRNAANAADIWAFESQTSPTSNSQFTQEWVELLAQDERIRIQVRVAAGGADRYNGIIWRRFLGST